MLSSPYFSDFHELSSGPSGNTLWHAFNGVWIGTFWREEEHPPIVEMALVIMVSCKTMRFRSLSL